jgi:hypothetical protein
MNVSPREFRRRSHKGPPPTIINNQVAWILRSGQKERLSYLLNISPTKQSKVILASNCPLREAPHASKVHWTFFLAKAVRNWRVRLK